jgi:hypothetical protein
MDEFQLCSKCLNGFLLLLLLLFFHLVYFRLAFEVYIFLKDCFFFFFVVLTPKTRLAIPIIVE